MIGRKISLVLTSVSVCLLIASSAALSADRAAKGAVLAGPEGSAGSRVATPMSGEQIEWQVISGGGGTSSTASVRLSTTLGQTAIGPIASANFKLNEGYWQNFPSGSCCVGATGNVNGIGIVDIADLSSLVSFLTGGGYVLPCVPEANVNATGIVDLVDLSALISYLTGGGYVLPSCP